VSGCQAGIQPALPKERNVLFMVVERFTPVAAVEIYRRVREEGRSIPEGLRYLDSWVRADLRGCYQLMECDDPVLLQEWIASWDDLGEFEVVPVALSGSTQELMTRIGTD
jgi:Protein of unknown function (DUF3303)